MIDHVLAVVRLVRDRRAAGPGIGRSHRLAIRPRSRCKPCRRPWPRWPPAGSSGTGRCARRVRGAGRCSCSSRPSAATYQVVDSSARSSSGSKRSRRSRAGPRRFFDPPAISAHSSTTARRRMKRCPRESLPCLGRHPPQNGPQQSAALYGERRGRASRAASMPRSECKCDPPIVTEIESAVKQFGSKSEKTYLFGAGISSVNSLYSGINFSSSGSTSRLPAKPADQRDVGQHAEVNGGNEVRQPRGEADDQGEIEKTIARRRGDASRKRPLRTGPRQDAPGGSGKESGC